MVKAFLKVLKMLFQKLKFHQQKVFTRTLDHQGFQFSSSALHLVRKNERISFKTKLGESINLRLNCRENLLLSPYPVKLEVRDVKGDCDVGDVALIKMGGLESSLRNPTHHAVCEGLIISKCIFLLKFLLHVTFIKSW